MTDQKYTICNKAETAASLDFNKLIDAIIQAAQEYASERIRSPERVVVPLPLGGVMLSMPAAADDIAIHKLVNVQPANRKRNIATIHGQVSVYDAQSGQPLFLLDGPEVTGRRTAAVSMLAIRTFLPQPPDEIVIIGTGTQARYHLQAINALHPACKVFMRGSNAEATQKFCDENRKIHSDLHPCDGHDLPSSANVMITLTTSTVPVYDNEAKAGVLVIGVGAFKPEMAELGTVTLFGSDIYVDDPIGARHEAGDLIQAGIDWNHVQSLASALKSKPDLSRPVVFKSVGTGAWDLAACRVAREALGL